MKKIIFILCAIFSTALSSEKEPMDLSFEFEQVPLDFLKNVSPSLFISGYASGHLSLNGSLEEINGQLSLTLNNFYANDLKEIEISTQLSIAGSIFDPRLSGTIDIKNGVYENFETGAIIKNIRATIENHRNILFLKEFSASDAWDGYIQGDGKIEFNSTQNYPMELNFTLNHLRLFNLDYLGGVFSGSLSLQGNVKKSVLRGKLSSDKLEVAIPDRTSALTDTVEVTYINQPVHESPPQTYAKKTQPVPIDLDVAVEVPKNATITGNDLDSVWQGSAEIKGTFDDPLFYGKFNIVSGQYLFNGKPFEIKKGTITLSGDPEKKTNLYVIAGRDLGKIKVEVILRGTLKNPIISFRSNPPLSQREILSWILFNRGSSEISPFQGSQLNESITNLSTKQTGPDVLTKIRKILGVDQINISRSDDSDSGEVNVQVGKYISQGVYVSINKSDISRFAVEATLMRNIKLQAEVGENSEGQIELKWQHDY